MLALFMSQELTTLADIIRDGLNKIDQSFDLFTEGTLQIGHALLEARKSFETESGEINNRAFGQWISRNGFGRLDKHTRAALINMARNEAISRETLPYTDRRSWRYLWEDVIQYKIPAPPPPPLDPQSSGGYTATTDQSQDHSTEPSPKPIDGEILIDHQFIPISELRTEEESEPDIIDSQGVIPQELDEELAARIRHLATELSRTSYFGTESRKALKELINQLEEIKI